MPDGGSSDEIIVRALSLPRHEFPVNVRWTPVDNTEIDIAYDRSDTRLFHAEQGSDLVRGLEQAMLVNLPECLEGVKKLSVEPTNMRLYLLDAFYRWVLAARNVPTLIPEGA